MEFRNWEHSPEVREVARRAHEGATRTLVRETNAYNCAGLIFSARRGWITGDAPTILEGPGGFATGLHDTVLKLLRSDGYTQLAPDQRLRAGDVVVYADRGRIEHVALVVGLRHPILDHEMVISKLGEHGEWLHSIADPPLTWTVHSMWTPREVEARDGP